MGEMSFKESMGWAAFLFFCAGLIGYFFYAPFHRGVNGFFWGIWEMIAGLLIIAIFYVLPFALVSSSMGAVWVKVSRLSLGAPQARAQQTWYQRLVILIPLSGFLIYLTLGWPAATPWVTTNPVPAQTQAQSLEKHKKHVPIPTAKEVFKSHYEPLWNRVYQIHEWVVTGLGLPGGNLETKENQPYDLGDVSALVWFCFFFGAPAFAYFLIYRREQDQIIDQSIQENDRLKTLRRDYEYKTSVLENQVSELTGLLTKVTQENQALRRVSQFQERQEAEFQGVAPHGTQPQGVLETDEI